MLFICRVCDHAPLKQTCFFCYAPLFSLLMMKINELQFVFLILLHTWSCHHPVHVRNSSICFQVNKINVVYNKSSSSPWPMKRDICYLFVFSCNLHLKKRHLTLTDWLITLCLFMSQAQMGSKLTQSIALPAMSHAACLNKTWRVAFGSVPWH